LEGFEIEWMKFHSSRRRRRSAAEIEQLLARYHRSEGSQAAFAREEGICLATLGRYLRSEAADAERQFVEIGTALPVSGVAAAFVVRMINGMCVEIPQGFSTEEASKLLGIVAAYR
jgi:hypothetical protein